MEPGRFCCPVGQQSKANSAAQALIIQNDLGENRCSCTAQERPTVSDQIEWIGCQATFIKANWNSFDELVVFLY